MKAYAHLLKMLLFLPRYISYFTVRKNSSARELSAELKYRFQNVNEPRKPDNPDPKSIENVNSFIIIKLTISDLWYTVVTSGDVLFNTKLKIGSVIFSNIVQMFLCIQHFQMPKPNYLQLALI